MDATQFPHEERIPLRTLPIKPETAPKASPLSSGTRGPSARFVALPLSVGVGAAAALLGLYIVVVGLAQGWPSAMQLLGQDAWLVAPITAAFGLQVALYTHLRRLIRSRVGGAGAITGASGGTSAAAMVACCAHRVADLLPILGLSAAAGFLAAWKVPFMIVGLTFSLAGIAVILRRIIRYRRQHMPKKE